MITLEHCLSTELPGSVLERGGISIIDHNDNKQSRAVLNPDLSRILVSPIDKERVTQHDEERLLEPFNYYRNTKPGKGRRQLLLQQCNYHLGLPQSWVLGIGSIIEDLHNSSLLIDDIEDESPLRRGYPTAHVTYGVAPTINSGNYVYFLGFSNLLKLAEEFGADRDAMITMGVGEMLEAHRGQGMEIWFRQHHVLPTIEEYIIMVGRKTGALLRLSVRLLQCHPQCSQNLDLPSIAEDFGILYQIRDDYINLASASYSNTKGFAEDISEGKYSFPIMHSLMISPDSGLGEILHQRPDSIQVKQRAIELIHQTDSFNFTRSFLQQIERRVREKIVRLGGNPGLEYFLSGLSVDKVEVVS